MPEVPQPQLCRDPTCMDLQGEALLTSAATGFLEKYKDDAAAEELPGQIGA